MGPKYRGFAILVSVALLSGPSLAMADENAALAGDLATLFRAARKVISVNQKVINDETKGDKGLSGDVVVASAKENYKAATGHDLSMGAGGSLEGRLKTAMIDAIKSTMTQAQPLINREGMGFKGFLPAVFAKQVADGFSAKAAGAASIKLTAPAEYVRNRQNRPDDWEKKVIETVFKAGSHKKGEAHHEVTDAGGRHGYRYMIPEYYGESCLGCHGEPKGERDMTGGMKEGGQLGELGGAISVVIFEGIPASAN